MLILATFPQVVPEDVRTRLANHPLRGDLLEVVMDLGRAPEARFLVCARSSAKRPFSERETETVRERTLA